MKSRQFWSFSLISLMIFSATLINSNSADAIQAAPFAYTEIQPDGTKIRLHTRGDEHFNWMEDQDGYTVVKNNGRFEYASRGGSGRLNPNGLVVGRDNPRAKGLQKHLLPSKAVREQSAKKINGVRINADASSAPQAVAPLGEVKNLVVMFRFADHAGRDLPSKSDIDVLFNAVGGDAVLAPTGSVKDVYLENSYGQMTLNSIINPGVNGWITVSNNEAYYANGQSGDSTLWQALKEALDELDTNIDFNDYDSDNDGRIDSIAFIHSGYGAEWGGTDSYGTASANRIWSHRWAIQPQWNSSDGVSVFDYHISPGVWGTSGSNIGRIGVIAHETGHFFGLPDLYDTDQGGGDGIGSWGMMANSWGFDGSQQCPPHFSPWSKIGLGWLAPMVISQSGTYTVNQAETNAEVYRINTGFSSGEYLLVENRQNVGFDCSIPTGADGLAIWHIDDTTGFNTEGYPGQTGWPANGNHYRVALAQADGDFDLEKGINRGDTGDLFRSNGVSSIGPGPGNHPNTDTYKNGSISQTGINITDISNSGASMSFCLNGCGAQVEPDAASNLVAVADSSSQINLSWNDNSDNETGFRVQRLENGSWVTVANTGSNVTNYNNTGLLAETQYSYQVIAFNSIGDSTPSNNASATTDAAPAFIDYFAQSQIANEGSISGSYTNTHTNNGIVQAITERSSGGNPRRRRSSLSFTWVFNVDSGNAMTLSANAWSSGSSDGDNFQFQYSTDNANFNNAIVVSSTSASNQQSAALPASLSGNVYIRVIDTNNAQGNSALDTISVDELKIRVDNAPVTPPAAPTNLSATAIAYDQIDLAWNDNSSDETGFQIERNTGGGFSLLTTLGANETAFSDNSVSAESTYTYRISAIKGASSSANSNQATATTPTQPVGNINLSTNGFKVKGKHTVDLTWSGASGVDIYRNGTRVAQNISGSNYRDNIGAKGGATYQYEICLTGGTSSCSDTSTVVF